MVNIHVCMCVYVYLHLYNVIDEINMIEDYFMF